jgi:hypothetical protein
MSRINFKKFSNKSMPLVNIIFCHSTARWSRGMILASGSKRGRALVVFLHSELRMNAAHDILQTAKNICKVTLDRDCKIIRLLQHTGPTDTLCVPCRVDARF